MGVLQLSGASQAAGAGDDDRRVSALVSAQRTKRTGVETYPSFGGPSSVRRPPGLRT